MRKMSNNDNKLTMWILEFVVSVFFLKPVANIVHNDIPKIDATNRS